MCLALIYYLKKIIEKLLVFFKAYTDFKKIQNTVFY